MLKSSDKVVIVATKRTPIGQYLGCFSSQSAPQLGAAAIASLFTQVDVDLHEIDEVFMGCVLPAGLGQAPARQALIGAKLPMHVPATTINKMCGSGMKALMIAHDAILSGSQKMNIAGGMESMSNAPYLLPKARQGYRMGHGSVYDHMFLDGLEDAYDKGKLMGVFAEICAEKYHFSREQQDEFALESLTLAQQAIKNHAFNDEIVPISITNKSSIIEIMDDELPGKAMPEKIPHLKPAFKENGTVTAANSSAISDGACAHLLMTQSDANHRGIKPLATIIAHAQHANEPGWFTTAPIQAIEKVLAKANWHINDVDLFEINEAFAVVTLAAIQTLGLSRKKVNIHGGACALGHPIGASGARIVTTLIYALKQQGLKKGVAALCIGGGEATAIAIEVNE
ncbi:acetyl-CoA C-acyltransferase [Candidatus Berkiella aquae]|uniref:Acetyl-CoA C-acyltransferase n=1 Tax=Candidatus Berkiella aquae TaxID=295108 RepID=A0A0Q9YNM5_9GAMM|nr:acetyl-CoA C-acyltransferase [Candidatus Berkiella aquae]MCS5712394.1 acetyl-CoA C-acyltransferase [Candidatus Berkiella aquae]